MQSCYGGTEALESDGGFAFVAETGDGVDGESEEVF